MDGQHYQAGQARWIFPDLGEEKPTRSDARVLLLTDAGICIQGHWKEADKFIVAWAPLPSRNHIKEALVAKARSARAEEIQRAKAERRSDNRPQPGPHNLEGEAPRRAHPHPLDGWVTEGP